MLVNEDTIDAQYCVIFNYDCEKNASFFFTFILLLI